MSEWVDAETCVEKALQLSDAHQWQLALEQLDAAIAINPGEPSWHGQRGQILDQLDRHEEAIEAYRTALELQPDHVELNTLLGIDLIRTNQLEPALQVYEKVARLDASFEPAYCHRIAVYTRMNDHERAEEMFYRAQQLSDDCPNCYHHIAESLACRGMFRRAIFCWKRALELDSDYPGARQRIAEAHRAAGEKAQARQHYLDAIRHEPGNLELLADLGDLLIEIGEFDTAAAKFQHVLDLHPESGRAHAMLGLIALHRGDPAEAISHLERGLEFEAEYPGLRAHLGDAYLRGGNYQQAYRHLSLALEDDPDQRSALMAMGNCLLQLQRVAEAQVHYERVLAIDPSSVNAHHNLAVCRFMQNDFGGGIQHCREALRIDPGNVVVLHKLALAYLHLGNWRHARSCMDRGLQAEPEHAGLLLIRRRFRTFQWRHWLARLTGRRSRQ